MWPISWARTPANSSCVRAAKISERGVLLTGVSQAFVESYLDDERPHQPNLTALDQEIAQRWGERAAVRPPADEPGHYQRGDEGHVRDSP